MRCALHGSGTSSYNNNNEPFRTGTARLVTCVDLGLGLVANCKKATSISLYFFYLSRKSSLKKENKMAMVTIWLSTYHVQLRSHA